MSGYVYLALILIAGSVVLGYRAFAVQKAVDEKISESEKE